MKKLKVIFIVTILIILTILLGKSVESLPSDDELTFDTLSDTGYVSTGGDGVTRYYWFSHAHLEKSNNVYCVEKGKKVGQKVPSDPISTPWKIIAKVEISGDNVTFYSCSKGKNYDSGTSGTSGIHNNKLAAILCEPSDSLGIYATADATGTTYTESQLALFEYWNTWVDASGAKKYGIDKYDNNYGSGASSYDSYATSKNYNVTLYYLEPGWNTYDAYQNLLLVERDVPTDREEPKTEVTVTKEWNDGGETSARPEKIQVRLKAGNGIAKDEDGNAIPDATLNETNNWTYTFTELPINDSSGNEIKYTIEEIDDIPGYKKGTPVEVSEKTFKITNTILTKVTVNKEWDDYENLDDLQPSSITVELYSGEKATGKKEELTAPNWTYTFEGLNKYDNKGKEINYTVKETSIEYYNEPKYTETEENVITVTNQHIPNYDGYIEITGKVWSDGQGGKANDINGTFDQEDTLLEGIKVKLKDKNGNPISSTYTDKNGKFTRTDYAETSSDGTYTIRVNYDNSENVYKLYEKAETVKTKLQEAYVEFEYDGLKYTTVKTATTGENTSKAKENQTTRNSFDSNHSNVTNTTTKPENWTDKNITAITNKLSIYAKGEAENRKEVIKHCYGNKTYDRTKFDDASVIEKGKAHDCIDCENKEHTKEIWKFGVNVEKIPNINLGLFEREQPDVALFSDISKVEVEMNNQRYTYLYGVRSNKYDETNENYLQTKFQNKDTYTYRRPVNPADIAYINKVNGNAMEVFVTYEIKVANKSTTLAVTIDSIINCYDSEYYIDSIIKDGINITEKGQESSIYSATQSGATKEIVLNNLNIEVNPQTESSAIQIRYRIDTDKIKGLLNNEAPLNNASEIYSYSTKYGPKTLYAEQGIGGRTGKPYGGYDYNSHPGNAEIKLVQDADGVYRLKSTENLVDYISSDGSTKQGPEDDTDIAPAFVLHKDNTSRVLSGTVWEDGDIDNGTGPENFRLGDGKKSESEKTVGNVKAELYKVNNDGSTTLATLYKVNPENGEISTKPAVAYSTSDGYYSFGSEAEGYSVVTDTYVMKFTYGEGITTQSGTTSSTIDGVSTNARNYKSTIINSETELYNLFKGTSSNKEWHLNISKGYSIAVDEMEKRIAIQDLQYSNFGDAINMTAYSKPFEMQVEFDASKTSSVGEDGKTSFGNELNVFDFGIIERAREDIFVQKTITNIKITLSNGQILAEGNPTDPNTNLNYTKIMGFREKVTNGLQARKALEKQILIEIDSELIQGAQLETKYAVNVVNNSEKDYDYYVDGNLKTEYYYFGTNNIDNSPIITSSVNCIVDYIDSDMVYTWENPDKWIKITSSDLGIEGHQLANNETIKLIENGEYMAYVTTQFSELAPGETSPNQYATAIKSLANDDENVFENHIEILQIDAKTARTIKGKDENGTPVVKEYKPGNYVPSSAGRYTDNNLNDNKEGRHEQDDDMAKIIVTPPTGATNYIITYVIAVLVGLVIVSIGVIIIKKKVLIK